MFARVLGSGVPEFIVLVFGLIIRFALVFAAYYVCRSLYERIKKR